MSSIADLKVELAADRIALSELINDFGVLESRFTTLTEDPTAVTVAGIQGFIDELDTFRVRGNDILKRFNALPNLIRATGSGPVGATEREALLADQQQLAGQTQSWISNTFVPFRDTARAEAARVTREDTAAAEKAKANPDPVSEWTATLNDGSGPGDAGTYYVINENGEIAPNGTGLTQQAAQLLADDLNVGVGADDEVENENPENQEDANRYQAVFNDGTGPGPEGTWYVLGPGGQTSFSGKGRAAAEAEAQRLNDEAETAETAASNTAAIEAASAAERAAAVQQTLKQQLQAQATRAAQRKQANEGDWRVKLRLAENANYLYRDPNLNEQGIMWPLALTNGVVFPYTPVISTSYNANYTDQALTHSNYKGYFYQSSHVGEISIQAQFTAQDTTEANYLLAVIHFFRSVTKMFYGKDEQRGSPPPLVYLSGLGMNQFYGHPCVVSSFTYNLPDNVDYIRGTSVNNYGTDLLSRRTASKSSGVSGLGATGNRIVNAGLEKFFPANKPAPDPVVGSVNNTQLANYVPTKMEIDITLIPVQTRSQVSKQFSLKGFANGDLIKGGFW
jgi:hypothetical protein